MRTLGTPRLGARVSRCNEGVMQQCVLSERRAWERASVIAMKAQCSNSYSRILQDTRRELPAPPALQGNLMSMVPLRAYFGRDAKFKSRKILCNISLKLSSFRVPRACVSARAGERMSCAGPSPFVSLAFLARAERCTWRGAMGE